MWRLVLALHISHEKCPWFSHSLQSPDGAIRHGIYYTPLHVPKCETNIMKDWTADAVFIFDSSTLFSHDHIGLLLSVRVCLICVVILFSSERKECEVLFFSALPSQLCALREPWRPASQPPRWSRPADVLHGHVAAKQDASRNISHIKISEK